MDPKISAEIFYTVCNSDLTAQKKGCAVLLSFQNSGNHLVRTLIESVYARPTLGVTKHKYSDKPIMFRQNGYSCKSNSPVSVKAHSVDDIFDALTDGILLNGRLLFIIRNPVDVIISKSRL